MVIQPLTSLKCSKINEAVASIGAARLLCASSPVLLLLPMAVPAPDRRSGRDKGCSRFNFSSFNIVSASVDPK